LRERDAAAVAHLHWLQAGIRDCPLLIDSTEIKRKASKDDPATEYLTSFKAIQFPMDTTRLAAEVVKEVVAKVNGQQAAANLPLLPSTFLFAIYYCSSASIVSSSVYFICN
jgi:hypothetical protein